MIAMTTNSSMSVNPDRACLHPTDAVAGTEDFSRQASDSMNLRAEFREERLIFYLTFLQNAFPDLLP